MLSEPSDEANDGKYNMSKFGQQLRVDSFCFQQQTFYKHRHQHFLLASNKICRSFSAQLWITAIYISCTTAHSSFIRWMRRHAAYWINFCNNDVDSSKLKLNKTSDNFCTFPYLPFICKEPHPLNKQQNYRKYSNLVRTLI